MKFLRWMVPLATAATIAVGALANTTFINGINTGDLSNLYDTPFTPSGYVFAIWGPLYIGFIAFSLWQGVGRGARSDRAAVVRGPYMVAALANISWLFTWHHFQFAVSLAVMLVLLGSVVLINHELRRGPSQAGAGFWCCDFVFRAYLGWVTVATLANTAQVLVHVAGADPVVTAYAGLAVALAIAALIAWRWRDPVILAVFLWAAVGIARKPAQVEDIALAAWLVAAVVAGSIVLSLLRPARASRQDFQRWPR